MFTEELQEKLREFIRSSVELREQDDKDVDVYSYVAEQCSLQKTEYLSPRSQAKEALMKLSGAMPNAEYYVTATVVSQVKRRFFE